MERIVVGQRVPIPAIRLPEGTTTSGASALRLRMLRPDKSVRAVSVPHPSMVRDPDDPLTWRYTGTADQANVWEWQWEFSGTVLEYGRFRVMDTGFS